MANLGTIPVDPATDVGLLRLQIGDTSYTETAQPNIGDFTYFSDAELQAILDSSGPGNAGLAGAYRRLAAILAMKSVNIATDDLKYSTEQRAEILRKIANDFQNSADGEAANFDHFSIHDFSTNALDRNYPEAAIRPYPWTAL